MPTQLFEYRFDHATWGLAVEARSEHEARQRLYAVIERGVYLGELKATIPAPLGWIARAWVVIANALRLR